MNAAAQRFSYGAHATFPVRYGWLPKGIERLTGEAGFHVSTDTADELGLGSKMVESLGFWLRAMGLSEEAKPGVRERHGSELAELVRRHDRFCELPGTWWFLHVSLATNPGTIWYWFFNDYSERIFDRVGCIDAFIEHTRSKAVRPATPAMAQKDVACLLSAYAARPGVDWVDPDDPGACPLRELGLIARHDHVGRFERSRSVSGVPVEVVLASAAALGERTGQQAHSLRELATLPHGPGRVLGMGLDLLEELVETAARTSPHASIENLAGERRLIVGARSTTQWLGDLYARVGAIA
ncbi:MAG: hypothetical protein QOH47_2519 [Sphingomonadales bacterium]|jgi:hypothetical protein|nr:hypothetical protein [Sphingomonadales bacterium]